MWSIVRRLFANPKLMPLGRWCHPMSSATCDIERKIDFANNDNHAFSEKNAYDRIRTCEHPILRRTA